MVTFKISTKMALTVLFALQLALPTWAVSVTLSERDVFYLPAAENSVGDQHFELDANLAEQVAYDPTTRQMFVVGTGQINVLQLGTDLSITRLAHEYVNGVELKQVRRCGKYFLITGDDAVHRGNGRFYIYRRYNPSCGSLQLVQNIPVGARPDDFIATRDCRNILVGIEGGPYEDPPLDGEGPGTNVDPPGYILRIQFKSRDLSKRFKKTIIGFEEFDDKVEQLKAEGLIQQDDTVPLSTDLEPEYFAFNRGQTLAWVTLQNNNAIAEIDWRHNKVTRIKGLGFKDHSVTGQGLDPSDADSGVNISPWPVKGARQTDQIANIYIRGKDYLVTANEGETIKSAKDVIGALMLNTTVFTNPDIQLDENLGLLEVITSYGDEDGNGFYEELVTFGSRDNGLLDTDSLEFIADTKDDFEQAIAQSEMILFNSFLNASNPSQTLADGFDGRSPNQGPEPESVAVACICGGNEWLVVSGMEKPGMLITSTIASDNPSAGFTIQGVYHGFGDTTSTNLWTDLYDNRMLSLIDPEGLRIVPAWHSPTGKPLLLATGALSSTLSVYEINVDCDA